MFASTGALHGLWYVAVSKAGTVRTATNCRAGKDFDVQASWVTSLWRKGKLEHGEFLRMSAELREGHYHRKRDVMEVLRVEKLRMEAETALSFPHAYGVTVATNPSSSRMTRSHRFMRFERGSSMVMPQQWPPASCPVAQAMTSPWAQARPVKAATPSCW